MLQLAETPIDLTLPGKKGEENGGYGSESSSADEGYDGYPADIQIAINKANESILN